MSSSLSLHWQRTWHIDLPIVLASGLLIYTFYQQGKKRRDPSSTSSTTSPQTASTAPLHTSQPPTYNLSPSNLSAACDTFHALLGPSRVSSEAHALTASVSTEWSPYPPLTPPSVMLHPQTTAEVAAIVGTCHARRIPVIARSGGTSLDGALASTRGGVVLDFSRMDAILAVHAADLDAVVQPAVGWMRLNAELEAQGTGLWLPVDPAPPAQIGGMIATNASGTNAFRHGPMRAWVLGLTVVLADGQVVRTRHRPRKTSAGYDLTGLMVGSAGTLGLVTEATVRLTARPVNVTVAVVPFHSIKAAVDCVIEVVQRGTPLGAVELLDETLMRGVNAGGMTGRVWREAPTLFIKFDGAQSAVDAQVSSVSALAQRHGCMDFIASGEEAEVDGLWRARKAALPSFLAMKKHPDDRFLSSDVAVPISRMPEIVAELEALAAEGGLLSNIIGHVGDGNFHFSVLHGEEDKEMAEALLRKSQSLAVQMEGTVTGEHGVGLALREALVEELGDEGVDMMRRIKLALDPLCILNPDKLVRLEEGI